MKEEEVKNEALANENPTEDPVYDEGHWEEVEMEQAELNNGCIGLIVIMIVATIGIVVCALSR